MKVTGTSVYGNTQLYDLTTALSDDQREREATLRADEQRRARLVCAEQVPAGDLPDVLQALGLMPYDDDGVVKVREYDSSQPRAKLDADRIAKMRDLRACGATYREIAEAFGVGHSTACTHTRSVIVVKAAS